MSIFGESTPASTAPEQDTASEAAETQEAEATEQAEETSEQTTGETAGQEGSEQTDSGQEHSEEELLAGKYKTVEDLVKGYKNLEKQFHQNRQPSDPQAQPAHPQTPNEAATDPNGMFWAQFQENPLGTLQYLVDYVVKEKTAPIYEQREQETLSKNLDTIAKDYKQIQSEEGMAAIFGKVNELATELGNPQLARNPSPRVLKMAAQELWGDSNAQTFKKAKEAGRQEAEEARRAKQGAASVAVTKKPTETPKTEADLIADNIIAASKRGGLFG